MTEEVLDPAPAPEPELPEEPDQEELARFLAKVAEEEGL